MLMAGFCSDTASIWRLVGYVVVIIKIVIPLLLIVLGMVDLGKAVISNEDKAINKSVTKLIQRFIAAVVVFFVPSIVNAVFNAIGMWGNDSTTKDDYLTCENCITNVNSCSVSDIYS